MKETKERFNNDILERVDKEQFIEDITLCRTMSEVKTSTELLSLAVRILEYIEEIETQKSFYDSLSKYAKSKRGTLMEYHRLMKERIKQLSIIEHSFK